MEYLPSIERLSINTDKSPDIINSIEYSNSKFLDNISDLINNQKFIIDKLDHLSRSNELDEIIIMDEINIINNSNMILAIMKKNNEYEIVRELSELGH